MSSFVEIFFIPFGIVSFAFCFKLPRIRYEVRSLVPVSARPFLALIGSLGFRTKVFMESFYACFKQGQGRAEALANTQKEFRESPERSRYRRPCYWDAFQLSGDWPGKLEFNSGVSCHALLPN